MLVRVPGRPEDVRAFTDAERDEAAAYAAETGESQKICRFRDEARPGRVKRLGAFSVLTLLTRAGYNVALERVSYRSSNDLAWFGTGRCVR